MVSSSRPSSPRNTQASTPRPGEARRPSPAPSAASAQPIAWAAGRAGLASGPRKLKVVPTPSSRRAHGRVPQRRVERRGEAERDAGLVGRPRRPAPAAGRAGCRAPRARRRDPDFDEADRLPCLTTGAPAPAATIAAIVEMFTDMRPVAAGADDVEQRGRAPRSGVARGVHRVDQAADLVDRLALGAQRHREAGDLRRASPRRRGSRPSPRRPARWSGRRRRPARRAPRARCGIGQAGAALRPDGAGRRRRRSSRDDGLGELRSGRSGAGRRPRRATRSPARRPAAGRSAPATGGHW